MISIAAGGDLRHHIRLVLVNRAISGRSDGLEPRHERVVSLDGERDGGVVRSSKADKTSVANPRGRLGVPRAASVFSRVKAGARAPVLIHSLRFILDRAALE
jgi:hypothetical protein